MFTSRIQEIVIRISMNVIIALLRFADSISFRRRLFIEFVNKATSDHLSITFFGNNKRDSICIIVGHYTVEEFDDESRNVFIRLFKLSRIYRQLYNNAAIVIFVL